MRTRVPQTAVDLIKPFEAFKAEWYLCPADVWTIGWGITEGLLPSVDRDRMPGPIDETLGEELLHTALDELFYPAVIDAIGESAHVFKKAALVSLIYNIGVSAFERSTLRKALIDNRVYDVRREWPRWRFTKGEESAGLMRRREVELTLWTDGWEMARRNMRAHRIIEMDRMVIEPGGFLTADELAQRTRERLSQQIEDQ